MRYYSGGLSDTVQKRSFVNGYWHGNAFMSDRQCSGKYGKSAAPDQCCVFKDLGGGVYCRFCRQGFDKKFLSEKKKADVNEVRRAGGISYSISQGIYQKHNR